jgi:hypothetical protein
MGLLAPLPAPACAALLLLALPAKRPPAGLLLPRTRCPPARCGPALACTVVQKKKVFSQVNPRSPCWQLQHSVSILTP